MTSPHFFKRFDCYDNPAFIMAAHCQEAFTDLSIDDKYWQRTAELADHCNEIVPVPATLITYQRIPFNGPTPVLAPVAAGDGQVRAEVEG